MIGRVSAVRLLAFRFLLSKASDRFLSFIAWVSVVGVALGVLALTVVTSVINGFESELTRVITGMNGDVVLYSRAEPVGDAPLIEQKIRRALPEVKAVTASFVAELMASGPDASAGAVLEGFTSSTHASVTSVGRRLVRGRLPESGKEVAIGSALGEKIGVGEGDELRLIVPFFGEGAEGRAEDMGGEARAFTVRVVGVVKMGHYEYDSKFVYAPIQTVQDLLKQPDKVNTFKIRLNEGANARNAAERLTDNFGFPFRARDWSQLNKNLLYAIELEKVVIAILLTAIIIVAAFNVVSTLMMMIHDKTKEIAILKAMGFRPGQSFALFCLIGMGVGAVGTALGVGLGLGLNWVLSKSQLVQLPADIYYIDFLPVIVRWKEIALIAGVAMLVTFAATLYPARRVSTRPPLEGIRYE